MAYHSTSYPRGTSRHRSGKKKVQQSPRKNTGTHLTASADPLLKNLFSRIGTPEPAPFTADPFQVAALEAVKKSDCLVTAPTGSGKTWIAEQAIRDIFMKGGKAWYASPLKALSNSKWIEFGEVFGRDKVGILTGDTKENSDADIIVGTTEILRNQLYDAMHRGENLDVDLVILDEAHYLGDEERGVVWEEIMIYLPQRIHLLLLSATIGNGDEIAHWLGTLRKKVCTVIAEETRPVPLHPLYLHPSGRIMPFLKGRGLFSKVLAHSSEMKTERRVRERMPPFEEIIGVLRTFDLLPALFFLKSRENCNAAVGLCKNVSRPSEDDHFADDLEDMLRRHPFLRRHKHLRRLRHSRVAAHHGGQLPAWKLMVESMMKKGYLDAVFATTTVAAGVNFPARTVVLFNSDQFNGHEFSPLTATAFHQMTGRAGRRGLDKIGFMLLVPGNFMDLRHVRKLFFQKPDDIRSRICSDFSMALNLLLSHTPDEIRDIFELSLADYQDRKKQKRIRRSLKKEFNRHLDFLQSEDFVNRQGRLTDDGLWTSQLRLDQPLLIAECLRREAFPVDDEALLSAIVAMFVYDRNQEIALNKKQIPKKLKRAIRRVIETVEPLMARMNDAGFDVHPLPLWPSVAIYHWARGAEWSRIIESLKVAEGDFAMLVSRTADNLQQILSLRETHPDIARCALRGKQLILREPVVFEGE